MKKMTLSELKPIFSDYANWLEDWSPAGKDKLVRIEVPIAQGVWLDRLRTGEYRPTFYIRNLCVPRMSGGMELHQFMPIKFHSLSVRRHAAMWNEFVRTAESEIYPKLRNELDAYEVYVGYQKHAVPNPAEAVSLAALAAYFGETSNYTRWKKCFFELLETRFTAAKSQNIEQYGSFFENLDAAENARSYLQPIIEENMKSEGYV